jgi:hypothetical protein
MYEDIFCKIRNEAEMRNLKESTINAYCNSVDYFLRIVNKDVSALTTDDVEVFLTEGPDEWNEYFSEDSSLLCSLDRIFDIATVFMIKGNSYRGKRCETIALSAGDPITLTKTKS